MSTSELKRQLDLLGVKSKSYSLFGELTPDTVVLVRNYYKWEVFYLDERGGRNDEKSFDSENDACDYIYKMFVKTREIEKKFGVNT
ncbi:hypothetical protein GCM10011375_36340 [Hymenobacter qilianensis]|uniref:Uncharacterized protein n=2 Tax=Hymenobacter qilianensis TaxID=1385715 RepID=A0ACB5PW53_9BACT|nr:hypothetical protein [Hymenobacter qilianensis]QNP51139.1 hypothetical protein H9L05_13640 [Hymenobacter qilianensis]GGF77986.1 hypothetical protein GCM10011375_36340 [Hymenobacter qilianensis]